MLVGSLAGQKVTGNFQERVRAFLRDVLGDHAVLVADELHAADQLGGVREGADDFHIVLQKRSAEAPLWVGLPAVAYANGRHFAPFGRMFLITAWWRRLVIRR